jgi:putative ABC transport system permease protein
LNLMSVDLGIETQNVITFRVSPELNGYKPAQSHALFERMESELAGIPGVKSVTSALVPLIGGSRWGNSLTVDGYSRDPQADTHSLFNMVGAGYLGKFGIPLVYGREFTENEVLSANKVAVVSQRFAKHFFGDQNPVGRRFGIGGGKDVKLEYEIIGVARDAHYSGVKDEPPRLYYTPWRQSDDAGSLSFYVRTALPPENVMPEVRRVMRGLDADLPLEGLRTMQEQISRNIRNDRLVLILSASFAVLATLLAMLGLYGVMAYSVTRRTREIGIRLALGARTVTIRGMVMKEVLVILVIGLALGVPAAIGLSRYAESQLYGVKSFDLVVLAGATLALGLAALVASYVPARRAMRVDPMVALRYE